MTLGSRTTTRFWSLLGGARCIPIGWWSLSSTILNKNFLVTNGNCLLSSSLSHWHTHASLSPLLFFNKNFLVRKENCLFRDSTTNFILLSATSSLFHHPFKCANTTKCKCVSIFLNIFLGLITHLDMPLDPSNDAKLDHSNGTRWSIYKQVCPSW